jgi:proteasome lid subunit RPN8/RPN11
MTLEIPRDLHDAMVAHCLREAPLECCGVLAGIAPRVSLFFPLRNAAPIETRASRYYAEPQDLIELDKTLRERNLNILAIYHSHPECEAIPSRIDLRENYYGPVPRIIVSLMSPTPDVRVWRLDADSYEELAWRLAGPADREADGA